MATHSNILAWKIPWTEKPGRVQAMVLQRAGHYLVTKRQPDIKLHIHNLSLSTCLNHV